ncbi:MAG: toxic anion resistance protein [Nitrincola lacisaponensis]|uniref:toxic anion resistance protein n=1 Tax=Nitrincola lacisaponensis TaxID=267850 RepID=UPI00391D4A97
MTETLSLQTQNDLSMDDESLQKNDISADLDIQSEEIVNTLFNLDAKDLRAQQDKAKALKGLGAQVQRELTRRSALLKQPMSQLVRDAEDGGDVAKSLLALQEQTNLINPNAIDFNPNVIRRMLARIPGVGTPISRWFAKFQSVDGVIQNIIKDLQGGQAQLERDNTTLKGDQVAMRELTFKLQDYIVLGRLIDQKITQRLENEISIHETKRQFIEEDILFPLRQRVMDLQQQLAVNQQGFLTSEILIRNNRELIRGVSRSLNVTITALNTAATLALALQAQKSVLRGVESVNKTTDQLLAQTANQLKTQGVDIHKQAANSQLDIEKLKSVFSDVQSAIDDIHKFRREALPQMAQSIEEMGQLTVDLDQRIQQLDRSEYIEDEIKI